MSNSSSRPVYVPRNKRRRQEQRFHGAFTGGFSAGYFNTVGSKEGWQPASDEKTSQQQQQQQQRPEDFMDEQDHNEWGGPKAVKQEYQPPPPSSSSSHNFLLAPPDDHVGKRLLRLLGWREGGSTAFVPQQDTQQHKEPPQQGDELVDEQQIMLSKRRLRKIQLQQQRVQIPQPKLDTTGLGFEPFEDAPEFRAHQERRRKLAQQRAHASRNVYRVNDVLGNEQDDECTNRERQRHVDTTSTADDPYVSYETVEDFVGTKSVGGFALREDEDDAYDDEPTAHISEKVRLNQEAYETVVYEHHESDDEAADARNRADEVDFGGVLSSWATVSNKETASSQSKSRGVTADGRPPLPGFVLGGSSSNTPFQRFRGPDLPDNYRIQKHAFTPDEHPLVLKALSRAVQLEVDDARKKTAVEDALQWNAITNAPSRTHQPRSDKAMAGAAFAGLAEAMKNRFTSQGAKEAQSEPTHSAGLSLPQPKEDTTIQTSESSKPSEKERSFKITRTVISFVPTPLLCKRFGVQAPRQGMPIETSDSRRKEEAYFQDTILRTAESASFAKVSKQASDVDETTEPTAKMHEIEEPLQRPPMSTYKSIFEPELESSEGDDNGDLDIGSDAKNEGMNVDDKPAVAIGADQKSTVATAEDLVLAQDESQRSEEKEEGQQRRSKRSRSDEGSSLSESSRRRRKEDRRSKRRKEGKKKKKRKKKSSKRGQF